MTNKHTWEVKLISGYSGGITDESMANIQVNTHGIHQESIAKIIAAAPMMLEVLEMIAGIQASEPYHKTDWNALVYKAKDIARAAIAKARGG